jgi:hypothetical protein
MDSGEKRDVASAASYFLRRAQAAVDAADHARSEDAQAAFYKEAETWLYMANHCLNPHRAARPQSLAPPLDRAPRERRSFQAE